MFEKNDKKKYAPGSIREMVALALPMVVTHACDTVMTFTDRLFLSKLGLLQMNAAMGGGITVFMLMSFFLGLTGYTTALVAQYFGANKKSKCAIVVFQAILLSWLIYPIIVIAGQPLGHFIFKITGIVSEQLEYQITYFDILIYSVIIALLRNCLSGFFCGIGKTRIVMLAAVVSMLVNIVANYILIFGKLGLPALGIKGAGLGTIIGGIAGLLILIGVYFKKSNIIKFKINNSFIFDKIVTLKLWRFGYPAGLEFGLIFLAFTTMVMIFHSTGPAMSTAVTIMFNWDMVAFIPLLGVEIGVTSLVGRYMGAGQPNIAHKVAMSGIKLGFIYSMLILILFAFFTNFLVEVFRPATPSDFFAQSKVTAVFMLRVVCFYLLIESLILALLGALRGAGDTWGAMCLTVAIHWIIVPIQFLVLKVWKWSVEATWILLVICFFIFSILVYRRYKAGKWKEIKIVS